MEISKHPIVNHLLECYEFVGTILMMKHTGEISIYEAKIFDVKKRVEKELTFDGYQMVKYIDIFHKNPYINTFRIYSVREDEVEEVIKSVEIHKAGDGSRDFLLHENAEKGDSMRPNP